MQVCVYNIIEINSSEKQLPLLILLYFFEKKYIAWDPLNWFMNGTESVALLNGDIPGLPRHALPAPNTAKHICFLM